MALSPGCLSSYAMSHLIAWRNLKQFDGQWERVGKVIASEIGLALLSVTSVAETVAYGVLALVSSPLYPVTKTPCRFFAHCLQSSSLTTVHAFANLFFNLWRISDDLCIQQRDIRTIYVSREEEEESVDTSLQEVIILSPEEQASPHRLKYDELQAPTVASLVLAEVLAKLPLDDEGMTKENVFNCDLKGLCWILANFIDLYIDGSQKEEAMPTIFKDLTISEKLSKICEHLKEDKNAWEAFKMTIAHSDTIDVPNDDTLPDIVLEALCTIKGAVSIEIQGDSILMECIQYACQERAHIMNLVFTEVLAKFPEDSKNTIHCTLTLAELNWILANFVNLYINGSQKEEAIPQIFKDPTISKEFSEICHTLKMDEIAREQFTDITADPDTFNDFTIGDRQEIEALKEALYMTDDTLQALERNVIQHIQDLNIASGLAHQNFSCH